MHDFLPIPTALPTLYLVTSGERQEPVTGLPTSNLACLHSHSCQREYDYVILLFKSLQWPIAFRIMSKFLSRAYKASHGLAFDNFSFLLPSLHEPSDFFFFLLLFFGGGGVGSLTRKQTQVTEVRTQKISHYTTREPPTLIFFLK